MEWTGQCSEWEITEAVIIYGGGFVNQLGKLVRLADAQNKAKLVAAFPEIFRQYDEFALHRKNQAPNRS